MTNEPEPLVLKNIEKYGFHINQVMAEGEFPPFSYSVGIDTSFQKPNLCVIGLKEPIAMFVINEYVILLKEGKQFETGKLYSDFLENHDICFEIVSEKYYEDYFGRAIWHYNSLQFKMLQLVYPTTSGIYPWTPNAPKDFLEWQPVLTHDGKTTITT